MKHLKLGLLITILYFIIKYKFSCLYYNVLINDSLNFCYSDSFGNPENKYLYWLKVAFFLIYALLLMIANKNIILMKIFIVYSYLIALYLLFLIVNIVIYEPSEYSLMLSSILLLLIEIIYLSFNYNHKN